MKNTTQIFNTFATTVELEDGNFESLDIDQFQKAAETLLAPVIVKLEEIRNKFGDGYSNNFVRVLFNNLITEIKGALGNEKQNQDDVIDSVRYAMAFHQSEISKLKSHLVKTTDENLELVEKCEKLTNENEALKESLQNATLMSVIGWGQI